MPPPAAFTCAPATRWMERTEPPQLLQRGKHDGNIRAPGLSAGPAVTPIVDPAFHALAIPALIVTAIGKGGFASGGSNVAVPAMSLLIPAPQAAGITLPLLCAMDIFSVWGWRRAIDRRLAFSLVPGAIIGLLLGTLAFDHLSDRAVKGIVGAIAVAFTLNRWLAPWIGFAPGPPRGRNGAGATAASAGAAFTSTLAHAGGPPLALYLLPLALPRATLNATTVVFFAVLNWVKLVPYFFLGQLSPTNLATSALLVWTAPVGVGIGIWAARRTSDAWFYRIIFGLLFLTGIKLLWDAIAG
jgi:hypothetical protein